ncbi:MAG: C-terminal binding protein [Dehalococcoidia bacterium]|nr:C-terminal binding protein [Dehalococcoidia bacterium]
MPPTGDWKFRVVLPMAVVNEAAKYPDRFDEMGVAFEGHLCHSEDEVIELACDADAIITEGSQVPIPRRVVENLAKCRIIAGTQIGYDSIDIIAAAERGILVTNVPGYCIEEVSDHAMALILACSRRIVALNNSVKNGAWGYGPHSSAVKDVIRPGIGRLRGRTLGLFGFGAISRTLVPKAEGFGLRIIACDPYADASIAAGKGVEMVDWPTLLAESDYLSIHAAYGPETRKVFNREAFKAMKTSACLINTARGGFIDEAALFESLKAGRPSMAALDVLITEPPSANPLLSLDNVICTGHLAFFSPESLEAQWRRPSEEVLRVLRGEWPTAIVNPMAKERFVERWGEMLEPSVSQ